MNKSNDADYGLVMSFLDTSESYTLGFEAGKIWTLANAEIWPDHMLAHTSNLEQIRLIAAHFSCDLFIDTSTDSQWMNVTFVENGRKPRLKLIEP